MITSVINKVYKAAVVYNIDDFGHSAYPVVEKFPPIGDMYIIPPANTERAPITSVELLIKTAGWLTVFAVGQNTEGKLTADVIGTAVFADADTGANVSVTVFPIFSAITLTFCGAAQAPPKGIESVSAW